MTLPHAQCGHLSSALGNSKNYESREIMEKQILKGKINPSRTQKLQSKRHLAHHVAAISDEGGRSESW